MESLIIIPSLTSSRYSLKTLIVIESRITTYLKNLNPWLNMIL